MKPHNVTNEQLVSLVLGELPSQQAHELEAHIRQCEPCEQQVERLRELLDCADRMAALPQEQPQYESANRKVLLAVKEQDQDQPRRPLESRAALFGRILMNSKWSKLAVAAVVALAVIGGLSLFTGDGTGKVYARVIDQLQKARTLTYSIVTMTGQEKMPTVRKDIAFKEMDDGTHIRITTADGYNSIVRVTESGAVEGINIIPEAKRVVKATINNVSKDPSGDPWTTIETLRSLPARADETLGRKTIDGRMLDGFRVQEDDTTTTVWIDPRTDALVRVEMEFPSAPGMNMILSDFAVDVSLDDSLFSMEPPEGYAWMEFQADASQVTEQDLVEFLRLWSGWTKDGTFPPVVAGPEIAKISIQMAQEGKFNAAFATAYGAERHGQVMYRGLVFTSKLPASTWRYAGQNVAFGDPATPIFWYQPQGSPTWRVIYADLHVADVGAGNLPK